MPVPLVLSKASQAPSAIAQSLVGGRVCCVADGLLRMNGFGDLPGEARRKSWLFKLRRLRKSLLDDFAFEPR